ncbi:MAG: hypothetical protein LBF88_08720 [Planctomycetaceae bacterium]|jgi:hypothetical protein|nr:hypothetical protein [Planctomycetaceae bacterium]
MKRLNFILIVLIIAVCPVFGGVFDCLWGGSNEETTYTPSYVPGMGGITLSPPSQPPINYGAPPPGQQTMNQIIPVQATPNTQAIPVQQATIPTITVPAGAVGSVGRPATQPNVVNLPQLPPGTEVMYVIPGVPAEEECLDGVRGIPATAANVVPPGTPGAIPVAIKTVSVLKPKVEYHWTYSPIQTKTETLVKVVHPRTGKVIRTYCQTDEKKSTLPWLHRKEVVSYETVTAKVGTPVSLAPSASTATNTVIQSVPTPQSSPPAATKWQSRYGYTSDNTPVERSIYSTVIVP